MEKITKSEKVLVLLKLFERQAHYTLRSLCERLQCDERSVYRSIKLLREHGFDIKLSGGVYKLTQKMAIARSDNFSTSELNMLQEFVDQCRLPETAKLKLLDKLDIASRQESDSYIAAQQGDDKLSTICRAIAAQKCVMLRQYHSGSDKPVTDRMVEPYRLVNGRQFCICYELDSDTCKLFKLSRAEEILPVPVPWLHKHLHQQLPMDVFRMCGTSEYSLSVTMDGYARNLLLDEYPLAENYITPLEQGRYRLTCTLRKYEGALRFFASVIEHVHIEQPAELIDLLQDKATAMQVALTKMRTDPDLN